MSEQPIQCSGPGPHNPVDGVLGISDRLVTRMLCPLCAALPQPTISVDPTPPAQVDTAKLAVAIANAKATPTLLTLQTAILALSASIAPLT